jgi:thiol-disulfide isomerase/thioredoxin
MTKNNITIIESITETDELIIALSNPDIHHVLWFGASWCAPCKQAGEHLKKISNFYKLKNKPLTIYKIDFDNFNFNSNDIGTTDDFKIKVLSEITKLPTILYFKDNVEQLDKRINGADYDLIKNFLSSIDELDSLLSEVDDF